MIQLPTCNYAVPLSGAAVFQISSDKPAFHEWINANLEGGFCMVASSAPMSLAVPRGGKEGGQISEHLGAIFMFEVYEDALHFKMRFGE